MIFQGFNLLMQRTCLKNICFPLELSGVKAADAKKKAKELSMMLFAKKKMRYVTLSDSELRLAKYALIQFRNALIAKGLPTEDVNALLLKLYK